MDVQSVHKNCRKFTRWMRSNKNTKDTDSGISSASSNDIVDSELLTSIASNIKRADDESKSNAFLPRVLLERSEIVERQLQKTKHMYLETLELYVQTDIQPQDTDGGNNERDKGLVYAENFREPTKAHIMDANSSVNSSSPKVLAKYNLRKFDKHRVPKKIQEIASPEKNDSSKTLNLDHPLIKSDPVLHDIKSAKHSSDENLKNCTTSLIPLVAKQMAGPKSKVRKLIKPRRKRKRNKLILNSIRIRKPEITERHRKLWKRSNDAPSNMDCITSNHKIFQKAVLEEFPFPYLLSNNSVNLKTENILMKTPEKSNSVDVSSDSTDLTPPVIKITISANLSDRKVQKINYMSLRSDENCSAQRNTIQSTTQYKNETNLIASATKNNNSNEVGYKNAVASDYPSASGSGLQKVSEPNDTYKFNKLRPRLKRFDAAKLREDIDKPVDYNHKIQKRSNLFNNENTSSKKIKINHDTNVPKENSISSPKFVKENILEKSVSVSNDKDTSEILEELPVLSSKEIVCVKPVTLTCTDITPKTPEKYPAQKVTSSPKKLFESLECLKDNFLGKSVQVCKEKSEANFAKPTHTTFDLRQRLNRQRSILKTPLLPLAKRPPTRITPEILSKLNQNQNNQDFDTISLFAESIFETISPKDLGSVYEPCKVNNDNNKSLEAEMVLYPLEEECQENPTPCVSIKEVPNVDIKCNRSSLSEDVSIEEHLKIHMDCNPATVETETITPQTQNLQEIETDSSTFQSPSSEATSVEKETSKVFEWMASASNETLVVSHMKLNQILRKFCFHYYKHRNCNYFNHHGKCNFFHSVPKHFKNIITELRPKQFKYMYNYILNKLPYLFTNIFHILVNYMKDQEKALVDMVKDVLHVTTLEKKPYVMMIISALKNLGLSFHFAVEEIFIAHSEEKWLVEILLDMVVNNQSCLEDNWDLIQKLMNSLEQNLDRGVVTDIFNMCINAYPPNKEFCKNVYIDLIATDRLDLSHEPENKIVKYINLLRSFLLSEYADHIRNKYNIHSNEEHINTTKLIIQSNEEQINTKQQTDTEAVADKELTFSSSSTDTTVDSLSSVSDCVNSIININDKDANSFISEPYIPGIEQQNVREYIPTQPFTIFNTSNQTYNYGIEYLLQQNSEEENKPGNSNKSVRNIKNIPDDVSSGIKGNMLPRCQHWASNRSTSSVDRLTENDVSDIANDDIIKLCYALKQSNMSVILSLFAKYSSPNLSKSFVIHLVTALKNLDKPHLVEYIVRNIFSNFENLLAASLTVNVIHLLQLFGLNMLTYLDCHKKYELANIILNKFPNTSDFITTECVDNFEYLSTSNLRYLFIFKILMRNGKLREALMFLKSLDLKLDDVFSDENPPKYLEYKKRLMNEFIEEGLKKNIPVIKDMLCFLILEVRSCRCIDFEKYLNQLIISLLNRFSEYKTELITIFQIIVSSWYKYLQRDVLRGLFIHLYNELSDWKILELYHINVKSKVYQTPEGNANNITIPSNWLTEEIYITLHLYFHSLAKNSYPVKNIIIDIKSVIEEFENSSISILTNSRTDSMTMKNRILNVLSKLPKPPTNYSDSEHCIYLAFEDIRSLLNSYKSESLPPLLKFR